MFSSLMSELAARFGLTHQQAEALIGRLLGAIAADGGVATLVDRAQAAGIDASGWLGNTDAAQTTSDAVRTLMSPATLAAIASALHVSEAAVIDISTVALPKLAGQLSPGGDAAVPMPPEALALAETASHANIPPAGPEKPALRDWLLRGVVMAVVLALLWWIAAPRPHDGPRTSSAPPAMPGARHQAASPAPAPSAAGAPSSGTPGHGPATAEPAKSASMTPTPASGSAADHAAPAAASPTRAATAAAHTGDGGTQPAAAGGAALPTTGAATTAAPAAPAAASPAAGTEAKNATAAGIPAMPAAPERSNDTGKALQSLAAIQPGGRSEDIADVLSRFDIDFETNSAGIPEKDHPVLARAAELLRNLPAGEIIEIRGYTDNTGPSDFNLDLSRRRAEAVRDLLIRFGADGTRLTTKGFGDADPIASNDTPEGRARNRRISYAVIRG